MLIRCTTDVSPSAKEDIISMETGCYAESEILFCLLYSPLMAQNITTALQRSLYSTSFCQNTSTLDEPINTEINVSAHSDGFVAAVPDVSISSVPPKAM